MKRVFLFLLTNLAVMLVLGVVLSIIMSALGLSHRSLGGILLIAAVFGFGGSFISLYLSNDPFLRTFQELYSSDRSFLGFSIS